MGQRGLSEVVLEIVWSDKPAEDLKSGENGATSQQEEMKEDVFRASSS